MFEFSPILLFAGLAAGTAIVSISIFVAAMVNVCRRAQSIGDEDLWEYDLKCRKCEWHNHKGGGHHSGWCMEHVVQFKTYTKKRIHETKVAKPPEYEAGYIWKSRPTGRFNSVLVKKTRQVPTTVIVDEKYSVQEETVERVRHSVPKTRSVPYSDTTTEWHMKWVNGQLRSVPFARQVTKYRDEKYTEDEYKNLTKLGPIICKTRRVPQTTYRTEHYEETEQQDITEQYEAWSEHALEKPTTYDVTERVEYYHELEKEPDPSAKCLCQPCICEYCESQKKCVPHLKFMSFKYHICVWLASSLLILSLDCIIVGALSMAKILFSKKLGEDWNKFPRVTIIVPLTVGLLFTVASVILRLWNRHSVSFAEKEKAIKWRRYSAGIFVSGQLSFLAATFTFAWFKFGNIHVALILYDVALMLWYGAAVVYERAREHRKSPCCEYGLFD